VPPLPGRQAYSEPPLIPGCSVAGDQDPSRFPVRARCRVGFRNASSPHRGRDLPCRALGKTDSGGGWLRVQLEQSGVPLLRRLGPGGPREWPSPCSDTLVWACSSADERSMRSRILCVGLNEAHGDGQRDHAAWLNAYHPFRMFGSPRGWSISSRYSSC
jgi:hypothetical protein